MYVYMYVCNFPNVERYSAFCEEKYEADKIDQRYSSNFIRLNNYYTSKHGKDVGTKETRNDQYEIGRISGRLA